MPYARFYGNMAVHIIFVRIYLYVCMYVCVYAARSLPIKDLKYYFKPT